MFRGLTFLGHSVVVLRSVQFCSAEEKRIFNQFTVVLGYGLLYFVYYM